MYARMTSRKVLGKVDDDVVEDGCDIVGDVDDDGMRAGPDARTHLLLVTSPPSASSHASPSTSARAAAF